MRAAVGLQITGDRRPRRPTDRRGDEQQRDHDEPGQVEANPAGKVPHEDQGDKGQPDAPEHALSLAADVEQPGVEGQRHRHPGKDQGGSVEDRLPDPDLAHEHVGDVELHGLHRVFPDQDDQQPDDQKGKDQLQQRHEAEVDDGVEFARLTHAAMPPVWVRSNSPAMSRPRLRSSISAVTWASEQ